MKLDSIIAFAAVFVLSAWCANAQTKIIPTNIFTMHYTNSHSWRVSEVTNIVMDGGKMSVVLETGGKAPVSDAGRTNIVNTLVTSGEFCRVRGHVWSQHNHLTLEYTPNRAGCRECKVCGAHQTQYMEWK